MTGIGESPSPGAIHCWPSFCPSISIRDCQNANQTQDWTPRPLDLRVSSFEMARRARPWSNRLFQASGG